MPNRSGSAWIASWPWWRHTPAGTRPACWSGLARQHLGGLIAPGPQLMQQSLFDATARVRPVHPGQLVELADNTADAVTSGCWQAAAALVDRFASRMAVRLGTVPELVLGGGDAQPLLPLLSQPARLSHDAVLRGLAVWASAP
jgi:type III pantothenate kinase